MRAFSCVCSASAHACILRNAEAHPWVQGWRSPTKDSKQRTVFKVRSVSLPRIVNCCNSARGCVTLWPGTSSSLALSPPLPALKACLGPSVLATFPFQAKLSPLFRFAPPSTKSRCICAAASVNGHQPSSAPPVPQHFLAPLQCDHSLNVSDHFCVHSWSRAKIQELSSHSSSARFKRILSSFQAAEIQLVH